MPTGVDNEPTRRVLIDCGPPSTELKQPRLRAWWNKVKPATATTARKAVEPILKVAALGKAQARQAGQRMAQRVIGLQRQANLPVRLMEASARSTLERPMARASDLAWQSGYEQTVQQHVPQMFVPLPEVEHEMEMGG